jgi:hypothetical protein
MATSIYSMATSIYMDELQAFQDSVILEDCANMDAPKITKELNSHEN